MQQQTVIDPYKTQNL